MNLGSVLKILHGRDYKHLKNGCYPVYGSGGIITYVSDYLCDWKCACIGRKGTIDKPRFIDSKAWFVDTLFYSKPFKTNDPLFQYYLFETINWNMYNEASGVPSLSASTIERIKCYIPSLEEQKRIALLLSLIDKRIDVQNKIIEEIQLLIKTVRDRYFGSLVCEWTRMISLIETKKIKLFRGNIIPKHSKDEEYEYPVYSSSTANDGLMGYLNSYMFDEELVTWSIDGGGNFFYRPKHKFNVTNVCGYLKTTYYNYRFLAECLMWQHAKQKFDYQSKAHPSVISTIYKLPTFEPSSAKLYALLAVKLNEKLNNEQKILNAYKMEKVYLLANLFI